MFANIMRNATKFKEKMTQEIDDRMGLSESYGCLWEPSENVEKCRSCATKFQLPLMKRKHHCRICAGVFCDSCCILPAESVGLVFAGKQKQNAASKLSGDSSGAGEETSIATMRICDGCKRCEVPGEDLRNAVRAKIDSSKKETPKKRRESRQDKERRLEEEASTGNAIDRLSMLVAVRVGENLGVQFDGSRPSDSVKLIRGSAYGEDDHPALTSRGAPDMGYFEINNKSKEFFCIKLLRKGGDQKFEVPRPSYLSVPPGGSLHAFFNEDENENEDENNLEVIILYNNPNDIPSDMRKVNFDTTLIASSKSLSACAKVDAFKSVIFYTVSSKNKNVLLKYKGEGQVVPRLGNSIKRVGFIGAMQGHRTAEDRVDYATNVKVIDVVFSVTS